MKEFIPIILFLSLIFSCSSISFATANVSTNTNRNESNVSPQPKIAADPQLFSNVGIDSNSLQFKQLEENGLVQYTITYDNSVTDNLQIQRKSNGEIQLDVYEESIHDIIVYQPDDTLFVNGQKITISTDPTGSIVPCGRTSVFSKKPQKWTSKDYTKYVKTYVKKNIETNSKIKDLAISTIATILAYALKADLAQSIATNILASLATDIRSAAEKYAPNSAYLSYSVKKYAYKNNTTIDKYYKHVGSCYVKKNCTGHSEKATFYEYNYINKWIYLLYIS